LRRGSRRTERYADQPPQRLPLAADWPYLWLDATYIKVRRAGRIVSVAAIPAFSGGRDAKIEIGRWINFYNHQSPHGTYGGRTPALVYGLIDRTPSEPEVVAKQGRPVAVVVMVDEFGCQRRSKKGPEPPRDCRRHFSLSHATMAGSSIWA